MLFETKCINAIASVTKAELTPWHYLAVLFGGIHVFYPIPYKKLKQLHYGTRRKEFEQQILTL